MKNLLLVLLALITLSGCASSKSIDTSRCIEIANTAEKNGIKSGDDLYKECLDKQYQKEESKKGFWEKSAENLFLLAVEIISS
ncbi:hypothetical protein tinsulaeT_00360 [Thalassotalea insulae]|uniref:Lipoprotein n=1 Tax=Thalassotalea insulae TaxID=2056778 RepID=A0ABQ6GPU3_9GAMM|nr:hypothetical protein [Thalassotalea insulae]GLX76696.1 hypothetical protein tinsulaeT_00360 [Thalassotalea insulae]